MQIDLQESINKIKWQIHAETAISQIMFYIILIILLNNWIMNVIGIIMIIGNLLTSFKATAELETDYFNKDTKEIESNKDFHIKRHKELHNSLDELTADFINITGDLPSKTTVLELMQWSSSQIINPTTTKEHENKNKE